MKKIFLILAGFFCFYSVALAETKVWITGDQDRIEMVSDYIIEKSSIKENEIFSERKKVMGKLNNKPWPGINISLSGPNASEDGVFVPMSDNVVKTKTFCDDQSAQINSILERLKGEEITSSISSQNINGAKFCGCVDNKKTPTQPFKLRSNYEEETVFLTFPRQKKVLLFWLEDVSGRKIYLPEAKISLTDISKSERDEVNYPISQFDPTTCTTWFIKWWDRVDGADRGLLHKARKVNLDNGTITVKVEKDGVNLDSLRLPWKVHYSKIREEKRVKDSQIEDVVVIFKDGILSGQLSEKSVDDRLVEIFPLFPSKNSWQVVVRQGKFEVKGILRGEYLIQFFNFLEDEKGPLYAGLPEFEKIIKF